MLSIICISNDQEKLDKCLLKSLKKQIVDFKYEIIIINSKEEIVNSAIDGLNLGVKKSSGDLLLFLHHDIIFENENELQEMYNYCKKINNFGIIGVAGTLFENIRTIGNIKHGIEKERVSETPIDKPIKVQALDECAFFIKKSILEKYPFDKNDSWHLYSVDYSLKMNILEKGVFVIPSQIYHCSSGSSINNSYYIMLKKLCKKYKKNYKTINTPMGFWSTNPIILNFQILKHKIKIYLMKLKGKI